MNQQTNEKLKQIKQSFRPVMNGTASRSMREKGVLYKINWGVSLPDLQQIAHSYQQDLDLAIQLWKEDIRECKILATMLMPPQQMSPDLADIWIEQTTTQELIEIATLNLYQHLSFAQALAFQSIAASDELRQMTGYLLLGRLFARHQKIGQRDIHEFLDQVSVALQSSHGGLRRAALNSVMHFSELGHDYAETARKTLRLDFL